MFRKALLTLTALLAVSFLPATIATPADSAVKTKAGTKAKVNVRNARARAGYAKWVQHGDIYKVDGKFGSFNRSFNVEVAWKGNGFVINTPLGAYRLKRRGNSVTFKVYFQKAWAHVTWKRSSASVNYKGQRGSARLVKVGNRAARKSEPKRNQNFNQN